jgi:hypothetical protein
MTVGVYGLVAGIVKLDDFGLYLSRSANAASRGLGETILKVAPYLMKGLSIAGTAAMFLVGGGILVHGLPVVHHGLEGLEQGAGAVLGALVQPVGGAVFGIVVGAVVLAAVSLAKKLFAGKR